MIEALEKLEKRYQEISKIISSGDIDYSSKEYQELNKEFSFLKPTVDSYKKLLQIKKEIEESEELLETEKEKELRELAEEEINQLKEKKQKLEAELKYSLIPQDPNSGKNIILEIRPGTGGDESTLFCYDLFRLYSRYVERNNWNMDVITKEENGIGGLKELVVNISGNESYDKFKYETGVHRVQRIPKTESGGRIHTSAVTVAVLPEADESDIDINTNDLKIDTYRAGGAGGQHVNTTDSAIRITHLPTGLVVTCQDERSQIKNKAKAMKVLRAKLKEMQEKEQQQKIADERKSQVGTGDRSERIRTYNFPQNRVTDHRINYTSYSLDKFMDGEIDEVIELLTKHFKDEALKMVIENNE